MMNVMNVVNTASAGAMAASMIFVSFLAAKSFMILNQLAKNTEK